MSSSETTSIHVSVIVPVYNQPEYLAKCLDALSKQSIPQDQFEVIVIDNGSKNPPKEIVSQYDFAKFGEESRPGSFAARNRAIEMSRGSVLAFTDADCLPYTTWLEAAIKALEGEDPIDIVAGRIDLVALDPTRPTSTELFDIAIRMDQQKRVKESNGVVTANLITRRELFDHVGPFDDSLMSGADAVWSARAAESGYIVRYVDDAIVIHPARTKLSEVIRQARRRAGGKIDMHARQANHSISKKLATAAQKLLPKTSGLSNARSKLRQRGYGWWAWVRVIWIMQLIHYASTFEIVWRWCGAPAERR